MSEAHREEILKQAADAERTWFWQQHAHKRPYRCPVCNGAAKVPVGFYNFLSETNSLAPEPCRSCVNGIVWG